MAQESFVQVDEGTARKLRTYQRTVEGEIVESNYAIADEPALPTYSAVFSGLSTATNNKNLAELLADANNRIYLRSIRAMQRGLASAAARSILQIIRLTSAGTGGVAVTARPHDPAEAPFGGSAMALPTADGAVGVEVARIDISLSSALPVPVDPLPWTASPRSKGIIVPAGAANGIAVRLSGGAVASATLDIVIEFAVADF